MRTIALVTLLAACAKAPGDAAPAATAPVQGATAHRTGTLTPARPPADAAPAVDPSRWDALAARLRARHVEDLPDRAALLAIPDAEAGLLWIAAHDRELVVRARALERLGVLAPPDAAEVLARHVDDGSIHPKLRAAAVVGLGRLGDAPAALDALLRAVADVDPQVAFEAVDALAASPTGRTAVLPLADRVQVLPVVRARIAALR